MSLALICVLLVAVGVYWFMTQILPERQQESLLRPWLASGLLDRVNERRHQLGLAMLEIDEDLAEVAERKAVHQAVTGADDEGWEYPPSFGQLLGRSLLMEMLLSGRAETIGERLARQRDLFDDEWLCCGIGVAHAESGEVHVAIVLCREAWQPAEAPDYRYAEA